MTNEMNAAPAQPNAPTRPPRTRSAGHIVAIVVGCLMLFPGLGMATGGGAIAIARAVATDDAGYFSFTLDRIETAGVAIATTDLWLDDVEGDASPWVVDWLDLDLRLRVDGAVQTDDVFVGIARSADVEQYLASAEYSEVTQLDDHRPRYRRVAGSRSIAPPLEQDFWSVSASGPGEQEVEWDARGGHWSVVVMNTDGTPLVVADVEVGARSGAVTPIAVSLLLIGGIISVTAIVLIVIGARGRRGPQAPLPGAPTSNAPFPAPMPTSAVDAEEHEMTPVG